MSRAPLNVYVMQSVNEASMDAASMLGTDDLQFVEPSTELDVISVSGSEDSTAFNDSG